MKKRPADAVWISYGSKRSVWWKCEKGHDEWQAAAASRAGTGAACPVCAGKLVISEENDLTSQFPAIAAQRHLTRSSILASQKLTAYSNRRVWRCCPRLELLMMEMGGRENRTAQGRAVWRAYSWGGFVSFGKSS